jgi:hypothetical protein
MPTINDDALKNMHHAPVIQMVKKMIQLFRKRCIEDVMVVQQLTRVADSSLCIEHIINLEATSRRTLSEDRRLYIA